jgi:hypothetical protein
VVQEALKELWEDIPSSTITIVVEVGTFPEEEAEIEVVEVVTNKEEECQEVPNHIPINSQVITLTCHLKCNNNQLVEDPPSQVNSSHKWACHSNNSQ